MNHRAKATFAASLLCALPFAIACSQPAAPQPESEALPPLNDDITLASSATKVAAAPDLRAPASDTDGTDAGADTDTPIYAKATPAADVGTQPAAPEAPTSAVGPSGIQIEEMVIGRGWSNHRCEEADTTFSAATDDKINLCLRLKHERVEQRVTVEWEREGKAPKRIGLTVKPSSTYRTRAWLPAKPYFAGDWRVRVLAEDGTELGATTFTVTP